MYAEVIVTGSKSWQSAHRLVHLSLLPSESKGVAGSKYRELHLVAMAPWPWKRTIPLVWSSVMISQHGGGLEASVTCQQVAAPGSTNKTLSRVLTESSMTVSWLEQACESRISVLPECLGMRHDQEEDPQFLEWLLQRHLFAQGAGSLSCATRMSHTMGSTLLPAKIGDVRKILTELALWVQPECQLLSGLLHELVDRGCLGAALLVQLMAWRTQKVMDGAFCLIDHGMVPHGPCQAQPWDDYVQQDWFHTQHPSNAKEHKEREDTLVAVPSAAAGATGLASARSASVAAMNKRAVLFPSMDNVIGPLGLFLVLRYKTHSQTLVPIVDFKDLWSILLMPGGSAVGASSSAWTDLSRHFWTLQQVAVAGSPESSQQPACINSADSAMIICVVTLAAAPSVSIDLVDAMMDEALTQYVQPLNAQLFPWVRRIIVVEQAHLKLVPAKLMVALDSRWILVSVANCDRQDVVAHALAQVVPEIKQTEQLVVLRVPVPSRTSGAAASTSARFSKAPRWLADPFALARQMSIRLHFYPMEDAVVGGDVKEQHEEAIFSTWKVMATTASGSLSSSTYKSSSAPLTSISDSPSRKPTARKRSTITFMPQAGVGASSSAHVSSSASRKQSSVDSASVSVLGGFALS